MDKKLIVIIAVSVAFVLIVFGATKGYEYLSENYYEEENNIGIDADGVDDTEEPIDEVEETDEFLKEQTSEIPEETVFIDWDNATASFIVYDAAGKEVELSNFFGKPIVVNFWASWCGPCTSEMPHFEKIYQEYGEDVQFLMVNVGDGFAAAFEFAKKKGYTFPIYHDSDYSASIAYGVQSIPMTLFVNADGTLGNYKIGSMSASLLEKYISQIK